MLLLLLLGGACGLVGGDDVMALDGDTFFPAVKSNPLLFVNFFAPWCGHCRRLEPELEQAAATLLGRVAFAKVDATKEVTLAEEFQVDGYPTILFLQNGMYEEYTGDRQNESIVKWVLEKSGPALERPATAEELDDRLAARGGRAAFVARGDADLAERFAELAESRRSCGLWLFSPQGEGQEPLVEVHRGLDEKVELHGEETANTVRLSEFLRVETVPLFGEITEDNYQLYITRADAGLIWVAFSGAGYLDEARRSMTTFRELALRFPRFPVVYVDPVKYKDHLREELGCSELPVLVVQMGNLSASDDSAEPARYVLALREELLTIDALSAWVGDVLAGKVREEDPLDLPDGDEDEEDLSEILGDPAVSAGAAAPPASAGRVRRDEL